MKPRRVITLLLLTGLTLFLGWRFIRPMNIFVVDDRFAWPVDTSQASAVPGGLGAKDCAACHPAFYDEWRSTIHSQAWTDPYFQADWQFEGAEHTCRLCHTPLDRQQPHRVLGYRDRDRWKPILADNPDFDPELQHEGVTCAACHYRDGKIVGVLGTPGAPHPVKKLADPNQVCLRCHIVGGERWDTFFRFPPCGTVAEIESTLAVFSETQAPANLLLAEKNEPDGVNNPGGKVGTPDPEITRQGKSGEITVDNTRTLGCVQCHMPLVERPLVEGGEVRKTRRHYWRGGHDPGMVKKALTVEFIEKQQPQTDARLFILTLTNTGAAHYVPTGTPDRHLTVHLRLLDGQGDVLDEQLDTIRRTVLWRPVIVDLRDNRLARWQPRRFELEVPAGSAAAAVEAEIRYHLLAESRRKRISYENREPVDYPVYRERIQLE